MARISVATAVAACLVAGTAYAQQASYTWTGNGNGSGKCTSYKMTIDVTVNGKEVKGLFKQDGRDQRHFEATLADNGTFRTKAQLGGGATMDVKGVLKEGTHTVSLDGYCKFDAKLAPPKPKA